MKWSLFFVLAVATSTFCSTTATALNNIDPKFIPGRYIVEFSDDDNPLDASCQKFVDMIKDEFGKQSISIVDTFDHSLMKGMTMQLNTLQNDNDDSVSSFSTLHHHDIMDRMMSKIKGQSIVTKMYPVRMLSSPNVSFKTIGYQLGTMNATAMWPHRMTQVDRVQQELKKTGKGIVVGIIDNEEAVAQFNLTKGYTYTSGIDYYHEAFSNEQGKKGCFGKGCKVALGYDLVGDDYNPHEPDSKPIPDPDPYDSCGKRSTGHGTHVAGIIAGNSTLIHGVAPGVTLGMWKVYGCYPKTSEDVVVKAMMDAYQKGVDIISVSIGSNNGWPESPMAVAAQRITEKGVPVVIAAGNEGLNGAYSVLAPAKDATVVGSFDNDNFYTQYFIDQNNTLYPYRPSQAGGIMPNGTIAAGDIHLGSDNDACDPNQVNKKVKGHIALAKEGGCSLDTKLVNLHEAGATGVIIYTHDDIEIYDGVKLAGNNPNITLVTTFNRVGVSLANDLAKGNNVTIRFGQAGVMPYPTGNTVSSFSGVGASYENDLKPDIAGIGGSVFSAVPTDMGNYGVSSGTSMACPYVAGSIALYLETHGNKKKEKSSPRFINEQLQVYGYKAPHYFDSNDVDTPLRQGGGLLQLYDAIQQTVHAFPSRLSFNDTANQIKSHTITLTNYDDASTASYTIINNVSVSLHPFDNSDPEYPFLEPAKYSNDSVSLRFSKKQFKLAPGKSVNITVSPVVSSTLQQYTMYSGYVQFKSDHPEKHKDLTVPYMGIIGSLQELNVFGKKTPLLSDANATRFYQENDVFECSIANRSTYPVFYWHLARPAAHIAMELYNNTTGEKLGLLKPTNDYDLPRSTSDLKYYSNAWNLTYIPITGSSDTDMSPVSPGKYHVVTKASKWLGKGTENHTSATILVKP